jgi:hypothetical protein
MFSRPQFIQLQPGHIHDYLAFKAFGKVDFNYDAGDRPTHYRASSMEVIKKSISFFHPLRNVPFCNGQGNPTKADIINKLIKFVAKCEVRKEGALSKAKRALTQSEFRMEMYLLVRHKSDLKHTVTYRTLGLWQYHLIGRIDDAANFKMVDPAINPQFGFALKTTVSWSKNVTDERQCPDQIVMGAMDDYYCMFIALSLHLESFLALYPDSSYLFTEQEDFWKQTPKGLKKMKASDRLKNHYRSVLSKAAWKKPDFLDLSDGTSCDVGTHSKRKLPSTYAVNCGASWEEVEIRGRWKGSRGGKIVNRYIDVKQLFHDAKVAGILCVGGPCKYDVKEGLEVPNEWLFEHVVPNIRRRFGTQISAVLAKALLYICLKEQDANDPSYIPVPSEISERVRRAYGELGLEEPHPVIKTRLHVYRINENLMIDAVVHVGGDSGGPAVGGGGGGTIVGIGANNESIQALLIRQQAQEQRMEQNHQAQLGAIGELRQEMKAGFRVLNNNIRCFGGRIEGSFSRQVNVNCSVRMLSLNEAPAAAEPRVESNARLSSLPRDLLVLWREYQDGLSGRKPARLFTTQERNFKLNKQKYYRRNVIWQCMKRQIARGLTPEQAAAELHTIYGAKTNPTAISKMLVADKRRYSHNGGYHPNLSV